MSDMFADADSAPDCVWVAACDHAQTRVAACYNLPYAAGDRSDPDFPLDGDWVERIALRFARVHREQFASIAAAVEA